MITAMHIGVEHIETKNETTEQRRERRNTDLRNDLVMSAAPAVVDALGLKVIGEKYRPEAFGLLAFGTTLGTLYLKDQGDKYNKYYRYGTTGVTLFFAWLAGSEWLDRRERAQEERELKRATRHNRKKA